VKRLVAIILVLSFVFVAVSRAAEANPKEATAVADVKKLGGFVEIDEKNPDKPVIGVSLKGTKVTNSGLECLEGFSNLQSLDLSDTKVTNKGLKRLKGLKTLRYLDLSGTKVSDSGLEHLKSLEKLYYLDLRHTKVVSVKDLEKALPKCSIMISK
jgi:Leucine-rich repeat (LRR) protein